MAPTSRRVTPPRRQMSGNIQRGSALSLAPMFTRKRTASLDSSARRADAVVRCGRRIRRRGPRRTRARPRWRGAATSNRLARRKASQLARQQPPDQRRRRQLGLQPERQRVGPFGQLRLVADHRCQSSTASRSRAAAAIASREGRRRPDRLDVRAHQQALRLAPLRRRRDDDRRPLAPGPPGAAAPVGQRLGVERQIGVHDQIDVGQVQPARRHVGGDQDAHLAPPELIERAIALGLGAIARDRRRREPARDQRGVQVGDRLAGGHEDDGPLAVRRAQHVDDRAPGDRRPRPGARRS